VTKLTPDSTRLPLRCTRAANASARHGRTGQPRGKLSTTGEHRIRTADARFLAIRDDEATTQPITETAVRNRP